MSEIKPGARVRHPSRGDGVVSTVSYSPLTKRPVKAWVEFTIRGSIQKAEVWAADLAIVETPVERPAFRLVDEPAVA